MFRVQTTLIIISCTRKGEPDAREVSRDFSRKSRLKEVYGIRRPLKRLRGLFQRLSNRTLDRKESPRERNLRGSRPPLPTEKIRRGERQVMQLLLQRMHRRGATAGRLDRFRRLDRGRGDGGGARGRDNIADRPRRQDAVDGEERRGGRHGGGGAARSRGDRLARVPVARNAIRGTDRTPGERPFVSRGVRRLARVVAPGRRDVILTARLGRVAVQIAVVVAVAGYTGTIVQRTRRLRHGRA